MRQLTSSSLPDIDRVIVNLDKINEFTSEVKFTELSSRILVEIASYVCVAACTIGDESRWNRDRAAVGGNMVRLYKLLHSVLDQTQQRRQEASFIFLRLIFETIVNIRYMIKNFSPDLIHSYVEYSLRHERKLYDLIKNNIEARNGIILPIEDRMLKSISRSAAAAGISLDEVDPNKREPWGKINIYQKAVAVDLKQDYIAAFGGASHSIHGNWHEIYSNHLDWDESDGFSPHLDWHHPRPQVLLSTGINVLETVRIYFQFMGGRQVQALLRGRLLDLEDRIHKIDDAHEAFLGK